MVSIGIGVMEPYQNDGGDLDEYLERLEQYFVANSIGALPVGMEENENTVRAAEQKKIATFLTLIGPETYKLLKNLLSPEIPATKRFDELTEILRRHLKPKKLVVAERFRFHKKTQKEGETIAVFETELRKLSSSCEFGEFREQALRDQFIVGIKSENTQRKLLSQDRTFQQALQIAIADEISETETRNLQMQGYGREQLVVQAVHETRRPKVHYKNKRKCYRCNEDHPGQTCKYMNAVCHLCKKVGHLARACRGKKPTTTNIVDAQSTPQPTAEPTDYSLFTLSTTQNAVTVDVDMDGKKVNMIVDTGAAVSLISEKTFYEHWGEEKLQQADDITLTSYTGQSIAVLGKIEPEIKYNAQTVRMPILVVKGDRPNLLGRNILVVMRMDWPNLLSIQQSVTSSKLVEEFPNVFSEGLGTLKGAKVEIYVDETIQPRFHKARPVPYAMKEKIEDELKRLENDGIIEPVTFSKWAAPIVPVRKGDGVRICGDYKVTVNRAILEDKYPLPKVDDLYTSLAGGLTFSKLDLSRAYLQLVLDEQSREYVTINTHKGLFQYTRLPFGVSVAPSVFQRTLESLLAGIPNVCIFLDDILVTGKTEQEHIATLRKVLQCLETAGLRLNKGKCEFFSTSVTYLGHRIDKDGLHPTMDKVEAVRNAPRPTDLKTLRAWLGIVNYYGRFLQNLSSDLAPLYNLLKKGVDWSWAEGQEAAFIKVKEALQSDALLVHFDPKKPILLACDASPYGCGAVLSHEMPDGTERPIAYASRSLSPAEKNYSQLDREGLSLIFGVNKFHQYLYGTHFTLITDHKPLLGLFNEARPIPHNASGRIQRWALTLSGYNYTIRHRSGTAHGNCDALSRLPLVVEPSVTPSPAEYVDLIEQLNESPVTATQIAKWTIQDKVLSRVQRYVLSGWPDIDDPLTHEYRRFRDELSIHDGCILRGARVVVPTKGRSALINLLHSSHSGVVKMKALARSYIWWPGLDIQIEGVTKQCYQCEQNAREPSRVPMRPWLYPQRPWSRLHLDYAGPVEGRMILVIIDAYSKWIAASVVKSSTTYTTIEELRKLFADKGIPETIVTDNGTCFTSGEFEHFMTGNNIVHIKTPAYHPSSNGLAERAVQVVKNGLKKLKDGSMDTRLARFLLTYRVTPHATTGVAPCELLYNRKLRTFFDAVVPDLNKKVFKQQQHMYNKRTKNREVHLGDKVFVKNHVGHGSKWLPSTLVDRQGDVTVAETVDGRLMRRHLDHVRPRHSDPLPQHLPIVEERSVPETVNIRTPETNETNREVVHPTVVPDAPITPPQAERAVTPSPPQQTAVRKSTREKFPVKRLNL